MPEYRGIDVSRHNGTIDWKKVAGAGVQFAIIRASYGWDDPKQIDPQLDANAKGCEANGIPYGFYHYSYAQTAQEAKKEAAFFLAAIRKYRPSMPVYFDFEEPFQLSLSLERQLQVIEAFLGQVEAAGYYAGLYLSAAPMQRLYRYAPERVKKYTCWVAHVKTDKPAFIGPYGMWQYSWEGRVNGSSENTDLNICYVDFPAAIKKAGLNGWGGVGEGAEGPAGTGAGDQAGSGAGDTQNDLQEEYEALSSRYEALLSRHEALVAALAAALGALSDAPGQDGGKQDGTA